ncbi:DUF2330 domain-containing protein [Anatilimnocola floriformis]|uniref:DUF2330 domain-containing protein n=1 Tax=Anatilimnocola floriformis TaxID=2948575 RepID=UPI0020C581DF|nr:DUF2330 domain-containing protein [Anatilimnocola floriformis]
MSPFSFRRYSAACLFLLAMIYPAWACCPAPRYGNWAVNADQTVIMLWDPVAKMQHFIRKASFQADDKDFGFIIPSPAQPELAESGNAAFDVLKNATKPAEIHQPRNQGGGGCGCSSDMANVKFAAKATGEARVLEEKLVAGFNATVLEADDAEALTAWLKDHDYAYSPAVAEWAKPYIEKGWKFTALKVAPEKPAEGAPPESAALKTVNASALRLSFATDKPLFPYREPDYEKVAGANADQKQQLTAAQRLLRIYFISNARYQGDLTFEQPWTGKVAWSGKVESALRTQLLAELNLPETTGPAEFHLTEFEDAWPYKVAPADVYFAEAKTQDDVRRPPVYVSYERGGDLSLALLIAAACGLLVIRRKSGA